MISIVIPFKNHADTIPDTLASIYAQDYPHWECILIDDQSTDRSVGTVKRIIGGDARFKLLEGRGGANVCRNIGLAQVRSPYVIFLDADDRLKPDCLGYRVRFFENHTDADFIVSDTAIYKEDISKPTGLFRPSMTDIDDLLLAFVQHKIQWNTTAPTWKKSFLNKIGGWNEHYPRLQDVELNIRALLNAPKIGFLNKKDSYYYFSPFTEKKRYNAQFGFLYLVRDYYLPITKRYSSNKELLSKFEEAFSNSIKNVCSYICTQKDLYNPFLSELVSKAIAQSPNLFEWALTQHAISPNFNFTRQDDLLEVFVEKWASHLQQIAIFQDYSLVSGLGGDFLFLFYAQYTEKTGVHTRTLQKLSAEIFKKTKDLKSFQDNSYWQGVGGLLQVLEILDKNEIADTDIGKVLHDIDSLLIKRLRREASTVDRERTCTGFVLCNRLRHYMDDTTYISIKIALTQLAENIIQYLENEKIDLYGTDCSAELFFLSRVTRLGLYTEPIYNSFVKFEKTCAKQAHKYPLSPEIINNLFGILHLARDFSQTKIENSVTKIISTINYSDISIRPAPYFRIDRTYLVFLNNMIDFHHHCPKPALSGFIESRLHADIAFSLAQHLEHKEVRGGIIGVSGIALSVLAYLDTEASSWKEILLV